LIIFCHPDATAGTSLGVRRALHRLGLEPEEARLDGRVAFVVDGPSPVPPESLERITGVARVVSFASATPRLDATREAGERVVACGPARFGAGHVSVVAGPCTIESEGALLEVARRAAAAGAVALRGGAFKARTAPDAFQGRGAEGVMVMRAVAQQVGLPFFTELTDPRQVEAVAGALDGIQIGARHMQNVPLLREAAATGKPVLLKRHFGASVDEWLQAAEYVLEAGNDRLILCERGVRAPGHHVRFLLDVGVVPYLKQRLGLPVIVDPSHAAGHASLVAALGRAAVAAGADGLIVETHHEPETTRCDARQALPPDELTTLVDDVERIAAMQGRALVRPSSPTIGNTSGAA